MSDQNRKEVWIVDHPELDEADAAMAWVERQVVHEDFNDELEARSNNISNLKISEMTPIQLLILAAHFYDERPAHLTGCYDNGPNGNKTGLWPLGDRIFHLFQWQFFRYKADYTDCPQYLKSKEATIQWMRSHGYKFSEMKSEYKSVQ